MKLKRDYSKRRTNIEVRDNKITYLPNFSNVNYFLTLVIFAEKRAKIQKELKEIEEQYKVECQIEQTKANESNENGNSLEKPPEAADEKMDTNNNNNVQNNNDETATTSSETVDTAGEELKEEDQSADQLMEL